MLRLESALVINKKYDKIRKICMSAISDTGPLISIFQSNSLEIVSMLVGQIYVTPTCVAELKKHEYSEALADSGSSVIVYNLTDSEERQAFVLAQQIASHPLSKDAEARNHLGEAEAMALALRPEFTGELLLIDERVAYAVAKNISLNVAGFAGLLLRAVPRGLLTADQVRQRLEICRTQGTHYGERLIEEICRIAQTMEEER
jgi:predicted nucleic acid-binding protein